MSCTFGTELKTLTPDLEKYYSKYFSNRIAIFNYYDKYQSKFNNKLTSIYSIDNQLTPIKKQIDNNQTKLSSTYKTLSAQETTINALKSSSVSQYNSQLPAFNNLVNQYNSLRDTTNNLVSQYNTLVDQRNKYVSDLNALDKAIDTKIVTN